MQTCYLVGAAPEAERILPQPGDFVIAVDGGLDVLLAWNITPDYMIGDFDSAQLPPPPDVPCKRYPAQKDASDMALALREALARGFRRIALIGAVGGRADHTYANIQLLAQAAQAGAFAVLHCSPGWAATMLCDNGSLLLEGAGLFSVFAYGGSAEGVDIKSARYPLNGAALTPENPLGLSNEITGARAEISLAKGALLVFWEADKAQPLVNV
ncbi:MAG: thiamine diphosphokinase [Oscillospiraceae bacterium]|jgi:thiamine pyrophosphokinase|nr:thiamine diphosphokinase [Oscillospiraceae bacterium]